MSGSPEPAVIPAHAPPSAASKAKSKKRKAQDDFQTTQNKKTKPSKQEHDDSLLDLEAGVNTTFAKMDPQLLADHVARQTKRFGTDLSSVELSDLYISANAIRDTTDFTKTRIKENLADFLEQFAAAEGKEGQEKEKETKRLGEAPPKNGAPHTIVVAGGGLRAADLVRASRKFQKKGNVVSKLVSFTDFHTGEATSVIAGAYVLPTHTPCLVCQALQGRRTEEVPRKEQDGNCDWHTCPSDGVA